MKSVRVDIDMFTIYVIKYSARVNAARHLRLEGVDDISQALRQALGQMLP